MTPLERIGVAIAGLLLAFLVAPVVFMVAGWCWGRGMDSRSRFGAFWLPPYLVLVLTFLAILFGGGALVVLAVFGVA